MYLLKVLTYNTSVCNTIPIHCWHQIMCHVMRCLIFFCLMTTKNYAVIIAAHNKHIIEMLQKRKILFSDMINSWKNKDVFCGAIPLRDCTIFIINIVRRIHYQN